MGSPIYNLFSNNKELTEKANEAAAATQQPTAAAPVVQPTPTETKPTAAAPVVQPTPTETKPTAAGSGGSLQIDPTSDTSGMDALASLYTSPEQEEKYRKASIANRRLTALGDALRHIGNIYYANKYAPAQQFNSPVLEQEQRYEREKAIRDANNLKYVNYRQAKAAQDARMKQYNIENAYKAASLALSGERLKEQQKQNEFMNQYRLDRNVRLLRQLGLSEDRIQEYIRHNKETENIGWARVGVSNRNADLNEWKANNPEVRTTEVSKTDANGNTTTSKTTVKTNRSGGGVNHQKDPYGNGSNNSNNKGNHKKDPYS